MLRFKRSGFQEPRGQLAQHTRFSINNRDEFRLRVRHLPDCKQTRACRLDCGERRLESMCQTIEDSGSQLLDIPACFGSLLIFKRTRPLEGNRSERGDRICQ